MSFEILPETLKIVSLKIEMIPLITHFLIEWFFLDSKNSPWISFTRTEREISLILDEQKLNQLKSFIDSCGNSSERSLITVEPTRWGCFVTLIGEMGTDNLESSLITRVSVPLAQKNIPILQISTQQGDFTLFPLDSIQSVVNCLSQQHFSMVSSPCCLNDKSNNVDPSSSSNNTSSSKSSVILPQNFAFGKKPMRIFQIPYDDNMISSWHSIIASACYNHRANFRESEFFSMTKVQDSLSLIMELEQLDFLSPTILTYINHQEWSDRYRWIKVDQEPLGFESCGIVSNISSKLYGQGISMFYFSTFITDYLLVHESDLDKAKSILNKI